MNIHKRKGLIIVASVWLLVFSAFTQNAQAGNVDGIRLLRLGWIYAIGFPDAVQTTLDPSSGLAQGFQTYRVMEFGGEQWYRLKLVTRQAGGGWFSPQGSPEIWVNLNYALWINDVTR